MGATRWIESQPGFERLGIGYFGASTGGAAALVAAAVMGPAVEAIVSRGGRSDLAGSSLPGIHAPTLLIVGGEDDVVIDLNRQALGSCRSRANAQRSGKRSNLSICS